MILLRQRIYATIVGDASGYYSGYSHIIDSDAVSGLSKKSQRQLTMKGIPKRGSGQSYKNYIGSVMPVTKNSGKAIKLVSNRIR